jgi:two-component system response regulator YesN
MPKVYIVDDEFSVIKWITGNIDWGQYSCEIAGASTSARAAADFIRSNPLDLLITDIRMPDMDGLELIRTVKAARPGLRVIIVSAHSQFEYAREGLKLGADNYLLKPLDPEELKDAVRSAADKISSRVLSEYASGIQAFRSNMLQKWCDGAFDGGFTDNAKLARLELNRDDYGVTALQTPAGDDGLMLRLLKFCGEDAGFGADRFFINNHKQIVGVLPGVNGEAMPRLRKFFGSLPKPAGAVLHMTVCFSGDSYKGVPAGYRLVRRYLPACRLFDEPFFECGRFAAHDQVLEGMKFEGKFAACLETQNRALAKKTVADAAEALGGLGSFTRVATLAMQMVEVGAALMPRQASALQSLQYRRDADFSARQQARWLQNLVHAVFDDYAAYKQFLHPYVRQILSVLEAEYANPQINLTSFAEVFGISSCYLGQLFHTQTGQYFNDYLTELRLNAVERALQEGRDPIATVAEKSGFASQTYMNRVFKKKFQYSPREYRQRRYMNET